MGGVGEGEGGLEGGGEDRGAGGGVVAVHPGGDPSLVSHRGQWFLVFQNILLLCRNCCMLIHVKDTDKEC